MESYRHHYHMFADKKGWAVPDQHELIIAEVFKLHDHFTEHDLANRAKLKECSASVLYEVLTRLVEAGMIRKNYFNQGRVYYEHVYGHMHHDHLVCLHCGKIEEFRDETIEKKQEQICSSFGYKMIKHSLHIQGLCGECQKKIKLDEIPYGPEESPVQKNDSVPLSIVPSGRNVKVVSLEGGVSVQKRLRELGIFPGSIVQVLANQFAGSFMIKVKSTRLAIGHNLTHKIMVSEIKK